MKSILLFATICLAIPSLLAQQENQAAVIHPEQSHVQTSRVLPFPAEKVWKLIAGFNSLPDFHASVPASRLEENGAVRYLTISEEAGGGIVVERLMQFDEDQMTFSYKIIGLIESPLPLHKYQAWVDLDPIDEKSCKLSWSSKFHAMGSTREEAEEIIRIIYKGCYDGIERVLGK